jgi:hypothetical protein
MSFMFNHGVQMWSLVMNFSYDEIWFSYGIEWKQI